MNQTPKLSLLLLTHNSLDQLKNFAWIAKATTISQVVVIDDFSTDSTTIQIKNILQHFNSQIKIDIFRRHLANDFAAQRNFALTKCQKDWIFWLDTDEIPESNLVDYLNHFQPQNTDFSFQRLDNFLGQPLNHGENNQRFIRLFNQKNGKFTGPVHEIWQSQLPVIFTDLTINHFPHPSIASFLTKLDFYTTIRADELFRQGIKTNYFEIVTYPLAKFIVNYFFKFGFLDGTAGMVMAGLMSFHSFLVRSKLWKLSTH